MKEVRHKGELFDKFYLTKVALGKKLGKSLPGINSLIKSGEILEYRIRDRDVFIIRSEFIRYLIS